jgi:hypothetical protein
LGVADSHRSWRQGGVEARTAAVSTRTDGQTFVISGALVRADKSPIEGAHMMIAEPKDAGYAVSIGEAGILENPRVMTDAKGRFSITVRHSLFKDRQEFVVVVPLFAGTKRPMRLAGSDGTIKIDKTTKECKLGRIGCENPIVR